MSAADERIVELLDRWLASVELHAGYLKLDDAAYAKAQDWPQHQRPTKWVVDLAHARLLDLKRQLVDRQARAAITRVFGSIHRLLRQDTSQKAADAVLPYLQKA